MGFTREALVERIFDANVAAYETATIYLGERLGLYRSLHDEGPATSVELAERTDTDERYVREWLEQQAVAGLIDVDGEDAPQRRRFTLPEEHAAVLLDEAGPDYLGAFPRFTVGTLSGLPRLLHAFRTGEGVAYTDYGDDAREGQAALNRPLFTHLLTQEWLPAIPDAVQKLEGGARAVDVACGAGWSTTAIAQAYPKARLEGFDLDEPSIELARRNAKAAGVDDRVSFHVRDAADSEFAGTYDVVTVFEALHDMADPVGALRTLRRLAADDAVVVVADEKVGDKFEAPNDDERVYYAWSVLFCLPTGRADEPGEATGTVLRPATLESLATEAGFERVEALPIDDDLWRLYRLVP